MLPGDLARGLSPASLSSQVPVRPHRRACHPTKLGTTHLLAEKPMLWRRKLQSLRQGTQHRAKRGEQAARAQKDTNSLLAFREGLLKARRGAGWREPDQPGQHCQSGSRWSGVYVLAGSMQLTASTWWGFSKLQNS